MTLTGGRPWQREKTLEIPLKRPRIREAVQRELDFDPLVDPTGITVKNMDGDVTPNGTVPSYPQYLQAARAAKRVRGVSSVHTHLIS